MCVGAFLACYACLQLQLEAGKTLFKGLGRAKMAENVILGFFQAELSGHMLVKVVLNGSHYKCSRFRRRLDKKVSSGERFQGANAEPADNRPQAA